jgi:excisionase family DNA binding protein
MRARMTPKEVAERLNIGTRVVYQMLERGILPGIRLNHRWLITRCAYEEWERTCGLSANASLELRVGRRDGGEATVN